MFSIANSEFMVTNLDSETLRRRRQLLHYGVHQMVSEPVFFSTAPRVFRGGDASPEEDREVNSYKLNSPAMYHQSGEWAEYYDNFQGGFPHRVSDEELKQPATSQFYHNYEFYHGPEYTYQFRDGNPLGCSKIFQNPHHYKYFDEVEMRRGSRGNGNFSRSDGMPPYFQFGYENQLSCIEDSQSSQYRNIDEEEMRWRSRGNGNFFRSDGMPPYFQENFRSARLDVRSHHRKQFSQIFEDRQSFRPHNSQGPQIFYQQQTEMMNQYRPEILDQTKVFRLQHFAPPQAPTSNPYLPTPPQSLHEHSVRNGQEPVAANSRDDIFSPVHHFRNLPTITQRTEICQEDYEPHLHIKNSSSEVPVVPMMVSSKKSHVPKAVEEIRVVPGKIKVNRSQVICRAANKNYWRKFIRESLLDEILMENEICYEDYEVDDEDSYYENERVPVEEEWIQVDVDDFSLDGELWPSFAEKIVATEDIKIGDFALEISESLIISEDLLCESDMFEVLKKLDDVISDTMLLLWSMKERYDSNSKFKFYLETLPENFKSVLSFGIDAFAMLEGTLLFEELLQANKHLCQQYDALCHALSVNYPDIFLPELYTWEQYLRACELWYFSGMTIVCSNGKVDAATKSLKFFASRPCKGGEPCYLCDIPDCNQFSLQKISKKTLAETFTKIQAVVRCIFFGSAGSKLSNFSELMILKMTSSSQSFVEPKLPKPPPEPPPPPLELSMGTPNKSEGANTPSKQSNISRNARFSLQRDHHCPLRQKDISTNEAPKGKGIKRNSNSLCLNISAKEHPNHDNLIDNFANNWRAQRISNFTRQEFQRPFQGSQVSYSTRSRVEIVLKGDDLIRTSPREEEDPQIVFHHRVAEVEKRLPDGFAVPFTVILQDMQGTFYSRLRNFPLWVTYLLGHASLIIWDRRGEDRGWGRRGLGLIHTRRQLRSHFASRWGSTYRGERKRNMEALDPRRQNRIRTLKSIRRLKERVRGLRLRRKGALDRLAASPSPNPRSPA